MQYRVEFSPEALAQVGEAHDWIAESSPERAEKWFQGLVETIDTLKAFPHRCPKVEDSELLYGEEVGLFLYGRRRATYRVLYAIREDLILIAAVLHSARDTGPA